MSTSPDVMTIEALRSVPLFASLDDQAASDLRQLLEVKEVPANTTLFRMGDVGDAMYLIESGQVQINVQDTFGQTVTLAELAQGDFFGEMAILDGKPRSADARVVQDARLAVLSRNDFLAFVRSAPEVAIKMMTAITNRLRQTDELLRQRVSRNVNEVEEARLTVADRMADTVSDFGGSWKFIIFVVVMITSWLLVNFLLLSEPYDFTDALGLMDAVDGVAALVLTAFVLISQNRQADKDRLRSDLDYQVNLKNELSLTEVLRRLDVIESERLPKLFEEQNAELKMLISSQRQ